MQLRSLRFFLLSPLVWLAAACATVPPQSQQQASKAYSASLPTGGSEAGPVERGAPVESIVLPTRVFQGPTRQVDSSSGFSAAGGQRATVHALGFGAPETAPQGLLDFCARQPSECDQSSPAWNHRQQAHGLMLASWGPDLSDLPLVSRPKVNRVGPIRSFAATSADIEVINRVNRQVNRAMVGVTDQVAFGRTEFWTMPLSAPEVRSIRTKPLADCEDFALEKRRALIAAGIPQSSIYLAVAVSPRTNLHAVVIVATDRGDLVLDNLNDWLLGYQETGYTWVKRQSTTSLLDWTDARVAVQAGVQSARVSQPDRTYSEAQATVTSAADDWSTPRWRDTTSQTARGGR